MLIHISMLTIWTSDTSFTAEPIGDQLSSLKQESQDTTTIVQTKVCIQSKFVAKIPGQKKPFPSWKCFVQEPFLRRRPRRTKSREPRVGARCAICRQSTWGEDSTHKPVVHRNMKIRNQKHWKAEPTCAATWSATTLGGVVTRGLRMLYLQADKIKRN